MNQETNETLLKAPVPVRESGFTLIEMMIVVAIIGMLAGIIGLNVIRRFDEARVESTKTQIRQLGLLLDDYKRMCGTYPKMEQGLDALLHLPQGVTCPNYDPEGLIKEKKLPKDAWQHEFGYESDGNKYRITSFGADGVAGGEGTNKDLNSDDL